MALELILRAGVIFGFVFFFAHFDPLPIPEDDVLPPVRGGFLKFSDTITLSDYELGPQGRRRPFPRTGPRFSLGFLHGTPHRLTFHREGLSALPHWAIIWLVQPFIHT